MTAATHPRLLSMEDWRALGEHAESRAELQEGILIVSPRPSSNHSLALSRLWAQLDGSAPQGCEVREEVDVIVDARTPATVRVPDIVVLRAGAEEPYSAADVLLAVEVLSPGTRRVDLVMKRSEYADAGIPQYWIVDIDEPAVRLEVLELADGAYRSVVVTDAYATSAPFDVTVDLTRLKP